ncbi:serine hydrolase [Algoriphagus sp. D3-2-R+10]|uniref:serine hydrolase n=1 Tax=Algoriphagus aurantiacus TaxID=3103948 RepID=UPI002B3A2820|nr:serine hydrolase [Algoriphagus sp. D3-2-R+10]MEB2774371.1 serine hydrolase [Algoriphagus sp. D3-2-R+10]
MKKLLHYLLLAIIIVGCKNSENSTSTIVSNIDSLMNYSYKNGLFNGTVLVSKYNKVIFRKSFGYADFDKKESLIPESSFYLASVSKQFTTMAVMILKERGKLSYDNKLSDYFPDFPEYADSVTIRHMMTHTSGIPDHFGLGAYKVGLNNNDVYDILINQNRLNFEPGSQFSYSNGGYMLLSMIIEKVTGESFHDFMERNIFIPLKMHNTLVYDVSEPMVKNRAIGYNVSGELDDYEIFTTGAGGIYSNIDDLFIWDQALSKSELVSPETLNEAYQPTVLSSGEKSYYGFGWGVNQAKNWVDHSGGLAGFRTYFRRYLDRGDAFVLLTNNGDNFSMDEINLGIDNILANEDFELPKVRISNKLSSLIKSEGIDKAIEVGKEHFHQNLVEYDELGINTLGYSYLQIGDIDVALKLFKLNVENRPNSGNAYDSYAEALLANVDTTAAIENYIKSVKMNPNNQNGINVLESLGVDSTEILPQVELKGEQLDIFIGKYELNPDFILDIKREGDHLFIHPSGQRKSQLFAATESRFYSKIVDAQLTFNKNKYGKVVSLTLHQGGDHEARKVN